MLILVQLLMGLLLVGLSCIPLTQAYAMGHTTDQKPAALYQIQQDDKHIEDSTSPLGYWKQSVSYPVISSSVPSANTINKIIKDQAYKFTCGELGDYTFTATLHSIDHTILSISYEAMWLCPQMPSPDSDMGSLLLNTKTGNPVTLKDEFLNNKKYAGLAREITENLRQRVLKKNKLNQTDCEIPSSYTFYYKSNDKLVFVSSPDTHRDSACAVEVEIQLEKIAGDLKKDSLFLAQ